MAKKKKKVGSTTHHRRRKVSGVKEGSMEYYLLFGVGAIAGGVASAYIVQALNTAIGSQAPAAVAPGIVAAGGLGVALIGKGNPVALGAGGGMAAVGGVMVLNETFLNVPGISGPPAAFRSNASGQATVLRNAVGRPSRQRVGVGAGPGQYLNKTVGSTRTKAYRMGMLAEN